MLDQAPLVDVRNLSVHFRSGGHTVKAVEGVSFRIGKSETFAAREHVVHRNRLAGFGSLSDQHAEKFSHCAVARGER